MKLITLLLSITLLSCNTERQLQVQKGQYVSYNGHVRFEPSNEWKQIPLDTTWRGFRVRNVPVRKYKLSY